MIGKDDVAGLFFLFSSDGLASIICVTGLVILYSLAGAGIISSDVVVCPQL